MSHSGGGDGLTGQCFLEASSKTKKESVDVAIYDIAALNFHHGRCRIVQESSLTTFSCTFGRQGHNKGWQSEE